MKDTLEQLIQLQKIDTRLMEIEEIKGDLPDKVRLLESQIAHFQAENEENDNRIIVIEKEIRHLNHDMGDKSSKLEKYKDQLYLVTTNKEYDALQSEIDTMKRTIEESENSILLLEEEKEKLEINIKENSENNKTLSGKLLTSRTELAEAITETEAEEKELLLNRASSIKDIPQDHLKYYDKYRLARDGIGIAEVTRNSCGSCYNYLTPQAIIEIKDRDKLILCSNCGVYLYYDSEE